MTDQVEREGEKQYAEFVAEIRKHGHQRMGLMTSWAYLDDPKRLAFMMARYKFVAKMLEGADHVLEVGCGDGFGTRIVAQAVRKVTAVDFDPEFIDDARAVAGDRYPISFHRHDMVATPFPGSFSGAYSLDVLEHIDRANEDGFISNIVASLTQDGVCIIGAPSLESQAYASRMSRLGHVNCKTQAELKDTMLRHFRNVFMFGMNDEVLHTGYAKMTHYNIALCAGPIAANS
ncbi:class I SAM-dependent methyltransferase [Methylocystis suflitae]|uniref:class I SAM-dependent methyltransferase n=1 Tax=Methylocystis suflitae TaxID=2951405 RepID=UPI002109D53B|nr:class I SAM-dependent methyltransferase [Methylocystis suflitae]MCQ4188977.1 class I SAM-dependent methyltransferase [Methylocystis suflitae]